MNTNEYLSFLEDLERDVRQNKFFIYRDCESPVLTRDETVRMINLYSAEFFGRDFKYHQDLSWEENCEGLNNRILIIKRFMEL